MILQSIPSISTNKPEYIAIVLLTLIFIGILKEFLADLKRYRGDKASNASQTQLLTGKILAVTPMRSAPCISPDAGGNLEFAQKIMRLAKMNRLETQTVRTDQIKVGDIIKVMDDQIIPADCFILASGSSLESQGDG
jgi:magnesium-transporting ATPase (P-type)